MAFGHNIALRALKQSTNHRRVVMFLWPPHAPLAADYYCAEREHHIAMSL